MPPFPMDTGQPGTVLRASGKDGPQRVRPGPKRFTPEAQALFLDHLAASCNVSWSAEQAGVSAVTAYNHRRANPGFARGWEEALRHGYVRLETELLGTAIEYAARLRSDDDLPLKHMSVREALALLGRHGGTGGGPTARGGRFRPRPRPLEEARDSILAKLEAIEAARLSFETGPAGPPQDERDNTSTAHAELVEARAQHERAQSRAQSLPRSS